jgi:hypothetical protein
MRGVLKDARLSDAQKDNHVLLQHRFDQRMLNANLPAADQQAVRSQIERQFYDLASNGRVNQPLEQTRRAVDDVFAATRPPERGASPEQDGTLSARQAQARQSLGAGLLNPGYSAEQVGQVAVQERARA